MVVLECGRVSAASAMLRRSHSAISRSVALLERRFKCGLLNSLPGRCESDIERSGMHYARCLMR